jgi:hypothetical protein
MHRFAKAGAHGAYILAAATVILVVLVVTR